MNIRALSPGIYKIRKHDHSGPYGVKHPRANPHRVQLLTVIGTGAHTTYHIDHDFVGQPALEADLSDYEILSRYESGSPQISRCLIVISFHDESGQDFSFSVRDVWSLRGIFDFFCWLRKPFGYLPRRK